jgi:hypothetical protein
MPQNGRSPGPDVVDVGVSIDIVHACTGRRGREEGGSTHRTERPHRGIDSPRRVFEGLGKQGLGTQSNAHVSTDCASEIRDCKGCGQRDPGGVFIFRPPAHSIPSPLNGSHRHRPGHLRNAPLPSVPSLPAVRKAHRNTHGQNAHGLRGLWFPTLF